MSLSPSRVNSAGGRTVPPHFIASNDQFQAPTEPKTTDAARVHAPSVMLTPPVQTLSSTSTHRYANADSDEDEVPTGAIVSKEDAPSPVSQSALMSPSSAPEPQQQQQQQSPIPENSSSLLLSPRSVEIAPSGEEVVASSQPPAVVVTTPPLKTEEPLRTSSMGQQALLEFDILGGSANTKHMNAPQGARRTSLSSAQTEEENPLELVKKTSELRDHNGKVKKMTFTRGGSPAPSSDNGSDADSSVFSSTLGSSATRSMVREKYHFDNARAYTCHRGRMVYSASMDRKELNNCYSWNCVCGVEKKIQASKRTFLEVHTNGIYSNAPTGCCCCSAHDNTTFIHFDDDRLGSVGRTKSCCSPCPFMFASCFDCCGESIYLSQSPNSSCGRPSNFGHCGLTCLGFLFPTNFFYGLQEGEAKVLVKEINQAKDAFKQRPPTINHNKDLDYYNGGGYTRAGMTSQHLGTGLSRMGYGSSTRGMMAGVRSPGGGSTVGTQSTGTHSVDSQVQLKPAKPYPVLQYYN